MRLGFIVILVGVLYLLKSLNVIDTVAWSTTWPIIAILIGAGMVLRSEYGHGRWCNCKKCDTGKPNMGAYDVCKCSCDGCKDCQK